MGWRKGSHSRPSCARGDEYRWFLWRYVPVRDEQDQIVRWYVTGTDIDDRKRAEDRMRNETLALREVDDFYCSLVGKAIYLFAYYEWTIIYIIE